MPGWWSFQKRRNTQARKKNARRMFESLERRELMAFNVSLTGGLVTFTGDSANDSLQLSVGPGTTLAHNLPLGNGIDSNIDLSSAPGVQSLAVAAVTGLVVDGAGGTDEVALGIPSNTGFVFSGITSGRSIQITAESITSLNALTLSGGDFTATGSTFTRSSSTTAITLQGNGVLTLNQTGAISISSSVIVGSASIGDSSQGASQVNVAAITAAAGDIVIRSGGSVTGGTLSASRAGAIPVGNVTVTAAGAVVLQTARTDGGNINISGTSIQTTSTSASISAANNNAAPWGAVTLTTPTNLGNTISLANSVISGSLEVTTYSLTGTTITTNKGDVIINAENGVTLSQPLKAGDVASDSLFGNVSISSTAGTVSVPSVLTDGGSVTIAAPVVNVTTGAVVATTASGQGGAVTLQGGSSEGGLVNVATRVDGGSILIEAYNVTGVGRYTTNRGNITINSSSAIALTDVRAGDSNAALVGSISITTPSAITYTSLTTDGGTVALTGSSITSTVTGGTITTVLGSARGSVSLTASTGNITINRSIAVGGLTASTPDSFSIAGNIEGGIGNMSISAATSIVVGGFLRTTGTGTISLDGGSVSVTTYLQTVNANISVNGSSLALVGIRAGSGDITIDVGAGAVTLGTTSYTADSFSITGGTVSLANNALLTANSLTLDLSDSISISGKLNATSISIPTSATTTFSASSIWYINLANTQPILTTAGSVVFENGSTVNIDATTTDVENGQEFSVLQAPLSSITNNGLSLVVSPLDSQGETIVLQQSLTASISNQFLQLNAFVYQPLVLTCVGACTLMLDTDSSPFGPTLLVKDAGGTIMNTELVPVGLITSIVLSGQENSSDSLTIDYVNGDPLFNSYAATPAGIPTSYDGLGGSGTDALYFVDSNGATNDTYSFNTFVVNATDANSGTINLGVVFNDGSTTSSPQSSTVTFAGLEPITSSMDIVSATFNLTAGDDAVTIANSSETQTSVAGATIETVYFNRPSQSISINGAAGNDTITIGDYNSAGLLTGGANLTLNGESVAQNAKLTTAGGNFTTTGTGTYTSTVATNSLDTTGGTGTGIVSIGQTGNVSVGGGSIKSFLVTGANNVTLQGALDTTAGNISITAGGTASLNSLSAVNGGAGTITVSVSGATTTLNGNWTTDGGQITASGVGFSGSGRTLNSGSGPLVMNYTGTMVTGVINAGSVSITNTGTFTGSGAITTSAGDVSISANTGATVGAVTAASVAGPAAISITAGNATVGFGNVSVTGVMSSNGGDITLTGGQVSNGTGATISATHPTTVSSSGTLTITANTSVNLAAQVRGGGVTINAGTTLTTQGTGTKICGDYASISITTNGNISLQDDVFLSSTALATSTVSINSGSGELAPSGNIYTDGGGITLSGASYRTNTAGRFIRTMFGTTVAAGSLGPLSMNFSGSVSIAGPVTASTATLTSGSFSTTSTSSTILTSEGGINLTATGAVSIAGTVTMNSLQNTRASSTISAGSNSVTLRVATATTSNILRSYGGDVTINSGTLNVNGTVLLYESTSRMGKLTLNGSGTMTIASNLYARYFDVKGGGNLVFSGSLARLTLIFNTRSPAINLFAQTGTGNLTFNAGTAGIFVNAYRSPLTGGTPGINAVLTTQGTYTPGTITTGASLSASATADIAGYTNETSPFGTMSITTSF